MAVPVGIALSSTTLYIKPGFPALQYLGVYSGAEQLMPVTYRLLADAAAADQLAAVGRWLRLSQQWPADYARERWRQWRWQRLR